MSCIDSVKEHKEGDGKDVRLCAYVAQNVSKQTELKPKMGMGRLECGVPLISQIQKRKRSDLTCIVT